MALSRRVPVSLDAACFMQPTVKKHIEQLREGLLKNLTLDFFDRDERDAILRDIDGLDRRIRQKAFALCFSLSNASSSLVPNAVKRIKKAAHFLSLADFERWIGIAFDLLDSRGVDRFIAFISKTDADALRDFERPGGLHLYEATPVLEVFAQAISGKSFKISPHDEPFTDTFTLFLPPLINRFKEREKNFFLYKLTVAYQWAQISLGTLTPDEDMLKIFLTGNGPVYPDIDTFFNTFADKELARDLYLVLEAPRLEAFLKRELPSLAGRGNEVRQELFDDRHPLGWLPEKSAIIEALYQHFLAGAAKGPAPAAFSDILDMARPLRRERYAVKTMRTLVRAYELVSKRPGDYEAITPLPFLGRIRPDLVSRRLKDERRTREKRIEAVITKLLDLPEFEPRTMHSGASGAPERSIDPRKDYLLIRGRLIEYDAELKDIVDENGGIPGGILVSGADIGGGSPVTLSELLEDEDSTRPKEGGIGYDEWDYRRGGYRKNWCNLYEQDVHPGHEPFVELALERYRGSVAILRKKFELLKKEPRMLRRQKDGDDVDIDATVEAFADVRAGLSPAERLFTRLARDERNIAVLFLLDMSGSTKGWVNEAEKESLVLMSEALEALGDRYSIYGFSGMTRSRCDFYRVKSFDEAYSEGVRRRIAGIEPKDYTRMGPPIRHASTILKSVDARIRLLIVLSDGKPEDWDAYKGDYGIEDTRRALIEAKEQGIHPFCITIDREAQSYLPHLFGEVNYIFIDDVLKLPSKITEIYRRLTT